MSWRKRDPKLPVVVGNERSHRTFFILNDEGGIRERFGIRDARAGRTSVSGTDRDDAFDARTAFGRRRRLGSGSHDPGKNNKDDK